MSFNMWYNNMSQYRLITCVIQYLLIIKKPVLHNTGGLISNTLLGGRYMTRPNVWLSKILHPYLALFCSRLKALDSKHWQSRPLRGRSRKPGFYPIHSLSGSFWGSLAGTVTKLRSKVGRNSKSRFVAEIAGHYYVPCCQESTKTQKQD